MIIANHLRFRTENRESIQMTREVESGRNEFTTCLEQQLLMLHTLK